MGTERRWFFVERECLDDGTLVLTHYVAFRSPWFSVQFNRIHAAEGPAYNHDHGAPYVSLVLWGSYVEVSEGRKVVRRAGSFAHRSAVTRHYIAEVSGSCLTLVIGGPRCNEWGFHPVEATDAD